jgi:hypothetical protein
MQILCKICKNENTSERKNIMILDCYIIREYLPNGKHTDHGYYERQEMLDAASDFISMAGES